MTFALGNSLLTTHHSQLPGLKMIALFFEVLPKPEHEGTYFEMAAKLKIGRAHI